MMSLIATEISEIVGGAFLGSRLSQSQIDAVANVLSGDNPAATQFAGLMDLSGQVEDG